MTSISISEINFTPVPERKGHIGFVSFLVNEGIRLSDVAVYTRLNPSLGEMYRLIYPKNHKRSHKQIFYPVTGEVRDLIERDVSIYLDKVLIK